MDDLFSLSDFVSAGLRVLAAYVLALPIGWERESTARSAGLRTFPLVAMASAVYVLVGLEVTQGSEEAQSRMIQGLMTGIGFVGAGAILKGEESVHGTATAASVWATGGIGAAAAYGQFDIAVLASLLTFATMRWITRLKHRIDGDAPRSRTDDA